MSPTDGLVEHPVAAAASPKRREDASFRRNREAWDDWSRVDPLWAIVTDEARRGGRWDEAEFFASGEATISQLWDIASRKGLPVAKRRALDFGCGVGRLTRALATRVDHVIGLDISEGMVRRARSYNARFANAEFTVHHAPDLQRFEDGSFDVVCSLLVLQHIPSTEQAERFLGELVRVLAAGGVLMLQLAVHVAPRRPPHGLRARLRARTRLATSLRRMGAPPEHLAARLGWMPEMPVVPIPDDRARQIVARHGGRVVWTQPRGDDDVAEYLYLITR